MSVHIERMEIEMELAPYKFEMRDGWPPDGESGDFFGFDADDAPSVLRWCDGNWYGTRLTFYEDRGWLPELFARGVGTTEYVVRWSPAPVRLSEAHP